MLAEYWPILLFIGVAAGLGVVLLVIGLLAGPRRPDIISWKARATVVGALAGYSIRSAHFT